MDLGCMIKKLRKKQNLKQSELAEKAGISRVALGNYERNDRIPSAQILLKIANALETTLPEIMGLETTTNTNKTDEIDKAINLYIDEIMKYLKKCCIELSIQSELLTDEYYKLITLEIAADISKSIDFDFYDMILSECYKDIGKIGDTISFKYIENIVKNNLKSKIEDLIKSVFIGTLENIYDNVNGTNMSKELILDNPVSLSICDIIANEQENSIFDDITDDIRDAMYDELFHDIFKEIIIKFIKQLNITGKEKALDYIKYLITNDENTEESVVDKDSMVQLKENILVSKKLRKA